MPYKPVIDGFEFAKSGSTIKGTWSVKEFPRLRDSLFDDSGAIEYELRGVHDAREGAGLRLTMGGTLQLVCQRCLGSLAYPLSVDRRFLLARSQKEIDAEVLADDGPDRLLASREMPVAVLIEDELLLELPLAPRHERCAVQAVESETKGGRAVLFSDLQGMLESEKAKRKH
ncbi:MAG: YceD family protein [Betaproteobacteria bacterium]|nr:YceD family protein [Betaproteobacteria bacterium]